MGGSKAVQADRRERVRDLKGRGRTNLEVLTALRREGFEKLALRTVERDNKANLKLMQEKYDDVKPLIQDLGARLEEGFRATWNVHSKGDLMEQLVALRLVKEFLHEQREMMQSLGILQKFDKTEFNQVNVTNTMTVASRLIQMGPLYDQLEEEMKEREAHG